MRELSIFIDESGDFGPPQKHSPYYVLGLLLHDQGDDIAGQLDRIHEALRARGLPEDHAIHTGPLIRREQDYRWLDLSARRSLFRLLVDFVRLCQVSWHAWVFEKQRVGDSDALVGAMAREVGAFIRAHYAYFTSTGLSSSERDSFSTLRDSAERALRKGYLKTMDRKSFESTRNPDH